MRNLIQWGFFSVFISSGFSANKPKVDELSWDALVSMTGQVRKVRVCYSRNSAMSLQGQVGLISLQ